MKRRKDVKNIDELIDELVDEIYCLFNIFVQLAYKRAHKNLNENDANTLIKKILNQVIHDTNLHRELRNDDV